MLHKELARTRVDLAMPLLTDNFSDCVTSRTSPLSTADKSLNTF